METDSKNHLKLKQIFGTSEVIIFDTEYTSWEGCLKNGWDPKKNQFIEIVQIAGIKVDALNLVETGFFSSFVRPRINYYLSNFFKSLTHISQQQVNKAIDLALVLCDFRNWMSGYKCYSSGNDYLEIQETCKQYKLSNPLDPNKFYDIRDVFKQFGLPADKYVSGNMTEMFNVKSPYKAHNALNDSRTILKALQLLAGS